MIPHLARVLKPRPQIKAQEILSPDFRRKNAKLIINTKRI